MVKHTKPAKGNSRSFYRLKSTLHTPIRKLSLKLKRFKPSIILGKRNKDNTIHEFSEGQVGIQRRQEHGHCHSGVALQNEDHSQDAIVITALDTVPFSCHQDLISMSREELIAAAQTLNAKLPAILCIDVGPNRKDSFIRHSIEVLVGIRADAPSAPTKVAIREKSSGDNWGNVLDALHFNLSPPATPSPTAKRVRPSDFYTSMTPQLERLREEDETEDAEEEIETRAEEQPLKRRRVSERLEHARPQPPQSQTSTPRPSSGARRRSYRVAPNGSPMPSRTTRSVSERVPSKLRHEIGLLPAEIDTTFITTSRPHYRNRSKSDFNIATSTPKATRKRSLDAAPSFAKLDISPVVPEKVYTIGADSDNDSFSMEDMMMK